MTDHYDELSVAPDPSRAEELRQQLHVRLASRRHAPIAPSEDDRASGSVDEERDDRDAYLVMPETDEGPGRDPGAVHHGRSPRRWLVVAAAAAAAVAAAMAPVIFSDSGRDDVDEVTAADATAESPFVGAWRSTDADASPNVIYVQRTDADTYRVLLGEDGTACLGRQASATSLVVTRSDTTCAKFPGSGPGEFTPQPDLVFTYDSSAPDQLVDGSGGVWRRPPDPAPDPEVEAFLKAFLDARLAGEGAEQHTLDDSDLPPPLLYATTTGGRYVRYEIDQVPAPDPRAASRANYDVRLFTEGGTVVQQGYSFYGWVRAKNGRLAVVNSGPTLENGRAVLLPFSLHDGRAHFDVSPSTWKVHWVGDNLTEFVHHYLTSAIVLAGEPLGVGAACAGHPTPTDPEAWARALEADSGHAVSDPVPVRVGGVEGLQVDVDVSADKRIEWLCSFKTGPLPVRSGGTKMRLLLADLPGDSAGMLTIALMTGPGEFEDTIAETAPIIDSVEIRRD
jgi:hypothetical protein